MSLWSWIGGTFEIRPGYYKKECDKYNGDKRKDTFWKNKIYVLNIRDIMQSTKLVIKHNVIMNTTKWSNITFIACE